MLVSGNEDAYRHMWGPNGLVVTGTLRGSDRLPGVDLPTLVIAGRHDEVTPHQQDVLLAGLPRGERVELAGSSHLGMFEEPDRYLAAVDGFLRRHDRSAR